MELFHHLISFHITSFATINRLGTLADLANIVCCSYNSPFFCFICVLLARKDYFTHFELSQLYGGAEVGDP